MRSVASLTCVLYAGLFAQINYTAGVEPGRITYYGETNCVACDIPQSEWPQYTAALSEKHFQGGLACGATARLMNNGKEIQVMIVDLCPVQGNEEWCSGDMTHFDLMGANTFSLLEPMTTGVKKLDFQWLPTPVGTSPIKLRYKDGINAWWVAIQVINHRYPVANLEIKDPKTGAWIPGNRKMPGMWNYWHFAFTGDGLKPPFQIRITDQFGQVIEETATELKEKYMWTGTKQFPLQGSPVAVAPKEALPAPGGSTVGEKRPYISGTRLYFHAGKGASLKIYDLRGVTVFSAASPPGAGVITLPELRRGVYNITIRAGAAPVARTWAVAR